MKNRTRVPWGLLLLVLIALAGQADRVEARDNVYIGADLGGLVMAFNTGSRYHYSPAPYPPPRAWYHHDRVYAPPPVVYGRPYHRTHRGFWGPPPRHHWRGDHWRGDHWRGDRW